MNSTLEEIRQHAQAALDLALAQAWKELNAAAQSRDRNAYHAAFTRITELESSDHSDYP